MAAITFPLAAVQENLALTTSQANTPDSDAITTPTNSNQAQGAPAPLDVVTLTGQAAQSQGTNQNQPQPQSQQNVPLFAADVFANLRPGQAGGGNNADAAIQQAGAQQTNAPATPASSTTGSNSTSDTTGAANGQELQGLTAGTSTQQTASQTQNQELQQLDATLQQLGIDPQSISIFNQLALLSFANNPTALKQFLSQFQQVGEQLLTQNSTTQPAAQNTSSPDSITGSADSPAAKLAALDPAPSGTAVGPTAANPSSSASAAPSGNTNSSPPTTSEISIQFQELQVAVTAVGGQVQLPNAATISAQAQRESLNVTF